MISGFLYFLTQVNLFYAFRRFSTKKGWTKQNFMISRIFTQKKSVKSSEHFSTCSDSNRHDSNIVTAAKFRPEKAQRHFVLLGIAWNSKKKKKQTNKQTNKQKNKQTNKKTNKQTNKQTNKKTNKQTNNETNIGGDEKG